LGEKKMSKEKLKAVQNRIQECTSIGELEHIEEIFKKDFSGMDKVDFETEWLKKYQELRG
jgi:hypothetical protein